MLFPGIWFGNANTALWSQTVRDEALKQAQFFSLSVLANHSLGCSWNSRQISPGPCRVRLPEDCAAVFQARPPTRTRRTARSDARGYGRAQPGQRDLDSA